MDKELRVVVGMKIKTDIGYLYKLMLKYQGKVLEQKQEGDVYRLILVWSRNNIRNIKVTVELTPQATYFFLGEL